MNTYFPVLNSYRTAIFAFFHFVFVSVLSAQNTIVSSGGNASGTGGTVSYSLGQVVYSTYSASAGTVTQGVQQPFEISVITSVKDVNNISTDIEVYPNPTTGHITLYITGEVPPECNAYLYNINGSLLINKKIKGNETIISMETLPPATYILKISITLKEIKIFKIIKH